MGIEKPDMPLTIEVSDESKALEPFTAELLVARPAPNLRYAVFLPRVNARQLQ